MATYEDFTIDQGSDLALQIELVEPDGSTKNLNGYTVSAKMKKTFRSTAADTVEFTSIVADPAESVELSYIGADGETIVERVLEGKIKVNPSVTR